MQPETAKFSCTHCDAPFEACACGVRAFHVNAMIENVPVEKNPRAKEDVKKALRGMNILAPDEKLISYREDEPFMRRGGESYGGVFTVRAKTPDEKENERQVYAKAIVAGVGETIKVATDHEMENLKTLSLWGIRIVPIYGYNRETATIYRKYLDGDWNAAIDALQRGDIRGEERSRYLRELARIAAIMDARGALMSQDFIRDLWTDKDGTLYYIDGGADLLKIGGQSGDTNREQKRKLLQYFPNDNLDAVYDEWYRDSSA